MSKIPLFKVHLPPRETLMPRLEAVLYSGQIGEGEVVKRFEAEFGAFIGNPNALSFSSGTAALHTALILAGVQPGDEVISTPMTAEPTNMAVRHAGARPVWADVDANNGNLSPESIAERIGPKTKAIVVVHYAGIPASIRRIREIAEPRGIPVIEDAAHALGAVYEGRNIGNHSEYVMFSLQAIKHMTTVDGGMLVCKNPADLPVGRRVRWFGIDRAQPRVKVDVREVGYKYHMNDVTATIGLAQLEGIRPILDRHIDNGRFYDRELSGVPGIQSCRHDANVTPAHWLYTVLADRRDDLARHLTEAGVDCSQAHRRNDQHPVFAESRTDLPGLDCFYSRMLHIPCGWWVTDEQREFVVDCIRRGW
jgi:dTDP-4-amino-4,6-dideoxygalactose transaminase